jgi:hypothetical protein
MKCPKCKYITFDYYDMCPRCGKDMAAEKTKLNIFSIKPNPPFLLGSLTGDLSDSSFDIAAPGSIEEGVESMELKNEEVYDDGLELSINIDQESVSEPDKDLELHVDDMGMSSGDKELELDLNSDNLSLGIQEETAKTEDINKEAGLEKNIHKESVQETKPGKAREEIYLESEDLKMNLDFDEESDTKK